MYLDSSLIEIRCTTLRRSRVHIPVLIQTSVLADEPMHDDTPQVNSWALANHYVGVSEAAIRMFV